MIRAFLILNLFSLIKQRGKVKDLQLSVGEDSFVTLSFQEFWLEIALIWNDCRNLAMMEI